MSDTTVNVTAEQRALVQRAVAANRAWRDRCQRSSAESEARKRWFLRSETRDEAIARGAECYLAAIRVADEEPPPPLVDVHIHALRAMVRAGELSPDDAQQIVQLGGGPFDRLSWREALDEEPRRRAFETEVHGRAALDCGRIDADIDDDTLTNELLYAWLPSRSDLAQRTILGQIPRPRLGSLLRDCLRLAANNNNNNNNDDDALASWMKIDADGASVGALAIALIERDDASVAELCERLGERRLVVADGFDDRWFTAFDERQAICRQLCLFGQHALALLFFDAIAREPVILRSESGLRRSGLSKQLVETLRASVAPERLEAHVALALDRCASREALADELLAFASLAAPSPRRSSLVERAWVAFDLASCSLDASLVATEDRAAWAPVISRRIDAWVESFDDRAFGTEAADKRALCAELGEVLLWVDVEDPAMVRSVWPALERLCAAVETQTSSEIADELDRWTRRAALFGSAEARGRARRRRAASRVRRGMDAMLSCTQSSAEAQARWIDRVIRDAPEAVRVLELAAPTVEQQRALDFARIESGRESLWRLVRHDGVRSLEGRAAALDRWYRAGCPIDDDGYYPHGALVELRQQARREGSCARRTRWQCTGDELRTWLESTDVVRDESWRAEPGLPWLFDMLAGDDRGRAQLRRLLDALLDVIRARGWQPLIWRVVQDAERLLPFASEAQWRATLDDDVVLEILVSYGQPELLRELGRFALRCGLPLARTVASRRLTETLAITTARGVAAFAESCAASVDEALALIAQFAPDVRALSDDWRGEIEGYLRSDRRAALRKFRTCDAELRATLRPLFEGSDDIVTLWAIEDDAFVLGHLELFAGRADHAPIEYASVLRRLGGAAVIDAIGDTVVEQLIDEQREARDVVSAG